MSINQVLSELNTRTLHIDKLSPRKQIFRIQEIRGDKRLSNVDLIWTQSGVNCCMAVNCGWFYGYQSMEIPCKGQRGAKTSHDPIFIDNSYTRYDHEKHRQIVMDERPKYATVRDVMTPKQCAEAGIRYYPPRQIKKWADDLSQYADNVIIVPKHKKAMDLFPPDKYMVGYSIPSSYGGCPIPITHFKDYRIHLLGGSPSMQIAYFGEMPDNVVSLDNNSLHKMAVYGRIWLLTGEAVSLSDLTIVGYQTHPGFTEVSNTRFICCAISIGNFAAFFRKKYIETISQGGHIEY